MEQREWRMDLQLFAEEGQPDGADGADGAGQTAEDQEADAQEKRYTIDEVHRLINSEADKRVTQALARQKKEFEKQMKRSGMEEAQRTLAEKDDRIAELEEQLREGNLMREQSRVREALAGRGVSAELAKAILIDDDADANDERVGILAEAVSKAVEEGVRQRIAGKAPAKGGAKPPMTREQFRKLGLREQQELAQKDIELYRRMTNGEEK